MPQPSTIKASSGIPNSERHLAPEDFSSPPEIAGSGIQSVVHSGDLIRVAPVSIDHRPAYRVGRDDHAARRSGNPVNDALPAEVLDRDRGLMDPGENGDLLLREGRVKTAEDHGVADRDAAAGILPELSRKFCGDVGVADPVGGEGLDIQRGSDPGKGVGQLPPFSRKIQHSTPGILVNSSASRRKQTGAPVREASCEINSTL